MAELSKFESEDSCSTYQDTLSRECRKKSTKANKKSIYVCSFDGCKKSYFKKYHLKRHEEIHTTGTFKCTKENCGKEFKTRFTLKKHIDNLHLRKYPKKYKCSYCDENFNKHSWFTKHVFKEHTGIKPILCPKEGCGKRFLFPSRLERHLKAHKDFTCTEADCGEVFSNSILLSKHKNLCHPMINKCLECGNNFSTLSNLKAHSEVHKPVREVIQCPERGCSRSYVKKTSLNHHLRSYHKKQPCMMEQKQCHKAFKSKTKLIGKDLTRKRSDIECPLKSTQEISFITPKGLVASSSTQHVFKKTRAKPSNTVNSGASHVQNNKTSSTSVSSKILATSSEKSSEVISNNNSQISINKDCRLQEHTESSVPDEFDEIIILPTPPKPQPPVITLDGEEHPVPCLNTRVDPDMCSKDLNFHKSTQTINTLPMSSMIPSSVVPGNDEIMILPTSPEPHPPVITLDGEEHSAPCLNTRVDSDMCSKNLDFHKSTQTINTFPMSSIPSSIVSGNLYEFLPNLMMQNNPNGIIVQMSLSTNCFQQ